LQLAQDRREHCPSEEILELAQARLEGGASIGLTFDEAARAVH
jgi:hypothetical protein